MNLRRLRSGRGECRQPRYMTRLQKRLEEDNRNSIESATPVAVKPVASGSGESRVVTRSQKKAVTRRNPRKRRARESSSSSTSSSSSPSSSDDEDLFFPVLKVVSRKRNDELRPPSPTYSEEDMFIPIPRTKSKKKKKKNEEAMPTSSSSEGALAIASPSDDGIASLELVLRPSTPPDPELEHEPDEGLRSRDPRTGERIMTIEEIKREILDYSSDSDVIGPSSAPSAPLTNGVSCPSSAPNTSMTFGEIKHENPAPSTPPEITATFQEIIPAPEYALMVEEIQKADSDEWDLRIGEEGGEEDLLDEYLRDPYIRRIFGEEDFVPNVGLLTYACGPEEEVLCGKCHGLDQVKYPPHPIHSHLDIDSKTMYINSFKS